MAHTTAVPTVRSRSSLALLSLALPFVILAAVAGYSVIRPTSSADLPQPGSRGALVWGNGIFASRSELKAWLNLHGGGYEAWARRHPAALRLVPTKAQARRTAAHRAAVLKAAARAQAAAPGRATKRSPSSTQVKVAVSRSQTAGTNPMMVLLVVIGVLLGAAAAAPKRLVQRIRLPGRWEEREVRMVTAGSGVALLLGIAIATQFG